MNLHAINWGNLMVNTMIALDILACLGYSIQGDLKRGFYWFACTLVMIAVRMM